MPNDLIRLFALLLAYLGLYQLLAALLSWHFTDPSRFLVYEALVGVCWLAHKWYSRRGVMFPLSMPIVLLAIVELQVPEVLIIGITAALLNQGTEIREAGHRVRVSYYVGLQAAVIATACFAMNSLLPRAWNEPPIRLLVAAIVLFVANTFPAAIGQRLNSSNRLGSIWRDSYVWALPHYFVAAVLAYVLHIGLSNVTWTGAVLILPTMVLVYRHLQEHKRQGEIVRKHAEEMAAIHLRAVEGLAQAVEVRENPNTSGHLRRVRIYALGIGKAMRLSREELDAIHAASLLHDVGKLAVPDHILNKPGKLSAEEFAKMKVHPLVGAEIVELMGFPFPVAPIVRAHHEKWNGSGYPFGLKGEEIPIGARILSTVDCLDALSSDREYRKAIPLEESVQYVRKESGRAFDPAVVDVLESIWRGLEREVKSSSAHGCQRMSAHVENGAMPDAGLEEKGAKKATTLAFLSAIAAARREEKQLDSLVQSLGKSLNLDETLERLHHSLSQMLEYDSLAFFERNANEFRVAYSSGVAAPMLGGLQVELGEGLTGWAAQHQKPVLNGNPAVDPGFVSNDTGQLRSALAFPLVDGDTTIAVLCLYRTGKDAFSNDDIRILSAIAPGIVIAVEHALTLKQSERSADIDLATGLPNRIGFIRLAQEEVSRGRRIQQPFPVVILRLSGAAFIEGQTPSPEILREFASALRKDCRDYDQLGYVAPNTFGFVFPGMKHSTVAHKLASLAATASALRAESASDVAFYGGCSLYPDDGDSATQLLVLAQHRATSQVHPAASESSGTESMLMLREAVNSINQRVKRSSAARGDSVQCANGGR